ncbi:ImuA family protein [Pelagibacterium halotolerans]|uniref:ImuA family protein n=1 Tax=Pelagibacterium halotolerans TaxID=531813 RepID=UPI00384A9DCD
MDRTEHIHALRQVLTRLDPTGQAGGMNRFAFGEAALDAQLGGGLARGAVHEVFAPITPAAPAAAGFVTGLVLRAAGAKGHVVWIRQRHAQEETGKLYPQGLAEMGLMPENLTLVLVKDITDVLRAGLEAARCPALGAVVIEPWGHSKHLDMTATRRLSLAGGETGVTSFLFRVAAEPEPSAAATRWQVRGHPSRPLAAGAPGFPAFEAALLRHREGLAQTLWYLEWDRDTLRFRARPEKVDAGFAANPALSGAVAPLLLDGPAASQFGHTG